MKERTSIVLRQRTLPSGRTTLYLDISRGGKRHTEALKLFLVPESNRADKQKNKETLKLAEAILAKRIVEAQDREFGFNTGCADEMSFYDYFKNLTDKNRRKDSNGNWCVWLSTLKHLELYDSRLKQLTFDDITRDWVAGFREYLNKKAIAFYDDGRKRKECRQLSKSTRASYFTRLIGCLNQAEADRIIKENPTRGIKGIRPAESTRMYLTIEEVRKLAQTECEIPLVKRAFLFSCLTGLRKSDVLRLRWENVHEQDGLTRLIFNQKKTGGLEYLDISEQATELLGERGQLSEYIFSDLPSPAYMNLLIKHWVFRAGIDKNITFHCARHTFAVMMLDLGTDIYTVSKLLGHRELSTTQIYAKVLDKNKQKAMANIPNIIHGKDNEM